MASRVWFDELTMTRSMPHEHFIRRCLELAERGRGSVGNGALVGAVLTRQGSIVNTAYHLKYGERHAERSLLENTEQISSTDYVLYVNLEPCCHRGKTPPCTDIIIESGVKTVVYGMEDPDPRVRGCGIASLRRAGVRVVGPVLEPLCLRLNRGFVSVRTLGRPWITLKMAKTKEGAIAAPDGTPLTMTGEEQNVWSHSFLRARHDAILVGWNTVRTDDPRLDVRFASPATTYPPPYRIILDSRLRLPLTARVVSDENRARTIVVHGPVVTVAVEDARAELTRRGVRLLEIPLNGGGFVWGALWEALTTPSGEYHGITSILVEGGVRTWDAFRRAGIVDEEIRLVQRS